MKTPKPPTILPVPYDITATESLKVTPEEAAIVFRALIGNTQPEKTHRGIMAGTHTPSGLTAEYYPDGNLFLFAEVNGSVDKIPQELVMAIAPILARLQRPYLEFGYAFSYGGGTFRITNAATIVHPVATRRASGLRASVKQLPV